MTAHKSHPPIDTELRTTVWPELREHQAAQAELTDEEFQQLVASTPDIWAPDFRSDTGLHVRELTIPAADGEESLPVLIIAPADRESSALPCVYYTANGGKMLQSTRMALTPVESRWVTDLGIVFVSISPRVGPAHRHPAQVEDAYRGLVWISENSSELGIDPERIMIMGKSGGGGIAAATALYARDQHGPRLAHQILICPMLDDRQATVSSGYDVAPWTSDNNRVGWNAILGNASGGTDVSEYAAPARATDLTDLPPAYLEVGSSEVFRDETLDYGSRLAQAGVPVELHSWSGGFHNFEIFAPNAEISHACIAARTSYIERALSASLPRKEIVND
ncbi:alpha/beta hydrolase family protein [Nocardia nova SH22a]|uniref:Alpha/beta hydrolase family protein n=1 Tax=Nocardia nova SH22a TaxID=1415166 RepID=W5TMX0_9NOCA|nr:alpha/beta hydrolase [Nocardia nova]AHH18586.1 alpha/beta hydrolase family protein [Nocardia nova SH22a]